MITFTDSFTTSPTLNFSIIPSMANIISTHVQLKKFIQSENPSREVVCDMLRTTRNGIKYLKNQEYWHIQYALKKRQITDFHYIDFDSLTKAQIKHLGIDPNTHKDRPIAESLAYVHSRLQTKEMCYDFINRDPSEIVFVRNKTEELCKLAVSKDPLAIQYIGQQTFDIICLAIQIYNELKLEDNLAKHISTNLLTTDEIEYIHLILR